MRRLSSISFSDAGTATDLSTLLAQPNTSIVYFWGSGVKVPVLLALPPSEQNVKEVSVGRTLKLGVTSNGRVLSWEVIISIQIDLYFRLLAYHCFILHYFVFLLFFFLFYYFTLFLNRTNLRPKP